jgi:hypothetical protein
MSAHSSWAEPHAASTRQLNTLGRHIVDPSHDEEAFLLPNAS